MNNKSTSCLVGFGLGSVVGILLAPRAGASTRARIVKTADDDLLVFTAATLDSPKARKLQNAGVEIVRVATWRGVVDLRAVLTELGRREILSVLLEAGPLLNGAALGAGLVDKVTLFYAPKFAGETGVPFAHMPTVPRASLQKLRVQQFGPDFCIEGYLRDAYR